MSETKPRFPEPPTGLARWLYFALAVVSLALGIVGVFLPVLPTVPFVLLAAWAAARSSPRLLHWLETHPRFGPPISDWRRGQVVRRRAKWLASALMAASATSLLVVLGPRWYAWSMIAVFVVVLAWLWRRPESFAEERGAGATD